MDKMLTVNQKRANKQPNKTKKKQQPLKVVYITNPIKFKTSASEFRALVQELTGQDADMSESSRFAVPDDVGGGPIEVANDGGKNAAEVDNVHAVQPQEVTKLGHICNGEEVLQSGSDQSAFGSCDDVAAFCTPETIENFPGHVWHEAAYFDVLKSLDAM